MYRNRVCGIYLIIIFGKPYVGKSVNLGSRWGTHLATLLKGTHHNEPLQRAFDKAGFGGISFSVLALCKKSELSALETHFKKALNSYYPNGYNLR